ncbi:MAG TPA: hypothetical protein VFP32_00895 [Candidatus Saccharimonadales bacterium]|nr:hypothetical protein [Candidatus Saccharimonadales bacterium]
MKPANVLRYVVLPVAALAAGVKLGIKYANDHYVVKDKKFIEGEIVKEKNESARGAKQRTRSS